jgi:sirohydrochlorin cobaltochelatase
LAAEGGPLGVLICGHGSRNRLAVAEFAQLAEALRHLVPELPVAHGYLEFARPILREGLDSLRAQGVKRVLAIPAMLFAAGHAKNDIPSVLNTYAAETGLRIDYGRELGVDLKMIQAAGARIREALAAADGTSPAAPGPTAGQGAAVPTTAEAQPARRSPVPISETLLVVVGRGSSDPDANSNVSKVTRMLVEGLGFGWGETVYSGVTFPLVEPGLRHAVRLGFRRIVVFPYFLFSGVLVSRIRQHTALVAADHPELEFVDASYLGDHPLVVETFRERLEEVLRGDTQMNCSLCKYRAQVLGFELEVGAPQRSHHHHVEGLSEACSLCDLECTGACQPDGIPLPASGAPSPGPGPNPGHHHHDPGHTHHDPHHASDPNHTHAHSHGQVPTQVPTHDHSHDVGHGHGHDHTHDHSHDHSHIHSHAPYPQADHPLGPRTLAASAQALRERQQAAAETGAQGDGGPAPLDGEGPAAS